MALFKGKFPDMKPSTADSRDEEWLLQYARAAWEEVQAQPSSYAGYPSRDDYKELWDYALSRNNMQRCIELSNIDSTDRLFDKGLNRVPIAHRFFSIVCGLVEKQGWKIRVSAIDPLSRIELDTMRADRKVRLMMRKAMPEQAMHPLIQAQPGEPDDEEELEVSTLGDKHPLSAAAQDIVNGVLNASAFDRMRRTYIESCFVTGLAVVRDTTYYDGIHAEFIPADEFVISPCRMDDLSDSRYRGRVRRVPRSSLPMLSEGEISPNDIEKIPAYNALLATYADDNTEPYVLVLELEIKTTDIIRSEEYRNREGNKRYRDVIKRKDGGDKEVQGSVKTDTYVENLHTISWVVGTDYSYGRGRQRNMKRVMGAERRVQSSYHVCAIGMRDMIPYSRMRAIRPMLDDIQVMNDRRRWTLARAVPSGYAFDLDALEDIDLSNDGKPLTKKAILTSFRKLGHIPFRSRSVNGQRTDSSNPVRFLKGGIGDEVVEYTNQIAYNITLIRQTLGLNDVTDGSTPNSRNLNSTNQAAIIGTNNAIGDIYNADTTIAENLASGIIIRAWDMLRPDDKGRTMSSTLSAIVGVDTVNLIKAAPQLDARRFGIKVEDDPSSADEEDFNASLTAAMSAGQISIDERFMAKNLAANNLAQAQAYLSMRVRRNKERSRNDAMQNIAANSQEQMKSLQAKAEADAQLYKLKTDEDIRKAQALHVMKMEEIEAQGNITLEREGIGADGRVGASVTQAKERDAANIRDNVRHLIKEGHDDKIYNINTPTPLSVEERDRERQQSQTPPTFSFLSGGFAPQTQGAMPQPLVIPSPAQGSAVSGMGGTGGLNTDVSLAGSDAPQADYYKMEGPQSELMAPQ